MALLRPKIVFDTQIVSDAANGNIPLREWESVSKFVAARGRYCISLNTLYELLASLAGCDDSHFESNRRRIKTLFQPSGKLFLPLVGDFVRTKVFNLPLRRLDFRSDKLKRWVEIVLRAKDRTALQSGKVTLPKPGHSGREYGFDFKLLARQIEAGKTTHSKRLEDLRQGVLIESTPTTWANAVLKLIDVESNDTNRYRLLNRLDAVYQFDVSLWHLARDKNYNFNDHNSDWLDSQQLYYLCDSAVIFVTKDSDLKRRAANSKQSDRIVLYSDFVKHQGMI